jgi:hypothetical protein
VKGRGILFPKKLWAQLKADCRFSWDQWQCSASPIGKCQRTVRDILLSAVKEKMSCSHRYEEVWHLDISSLLTGCLVVRPFQFRDPPLPESEDTVAGLLLPWRMVKSLKALVRGPLNVRLKECSPLGRLRLVLNDGSGWNEVSLEYAKKVSGGSLVIGAPRGTFSPCSEGLRCWIFYCHGG